MDQEAAERLADAVRSRREELRMTQEEAGQWAGVSTPTWRAIEGAQRDNIRPQTALGVSDALDWTADSVQQVLAGNAPRTFEAERDHWTGVRSDFRTAQAAGLDWEGPTESEIEVALSHATHVVQRRLTYLRQRTTAPHAKPAADAVTQAETVGIELDLQGVHRLLSTDIHLLRAELTRLRGVVGSLGIAVHRIARATGVSLDEVGLPPATPDEPPDAQDQR